MAIFYILLGKTIGKLNSKKDFKKVKNYLQSPLWVLPIIRDALKYIKNKKENLLSSSNLSFEALFAKMLFIYERALKTVGVEPKSLGANALRSIFLML